jgi:hypothetical protein
MESEGSDSVFTKDGHEKIAFKSVKSKIYKKDNNYNSFTLFHKLVAVYFAENVLKRGEQLNPKEFLSKNPKVNPDVLRKWMVAESNLEVLQFLEKQHGNDHFERWIPGFSNEGVAFQWLNSNNVLIPFKDINKDILKGYGFSYTQTRLKSPGLKKCIEHLNKHGKFYLINILQNM